MRIFSLKKKMSSRNYYPLVPAIQKAPRDFTKAEAKEYLNWYITHIDERSSLIISLAEQDLNTSVGCRDDSPEILIFIWRWFLMIEKTENPSETTIRARINSMKRDGMKDDFIRDTITETTDFDVRTKYIIRDIGMLLGKIFIVNHSSLRWGIDSKKSAYCFCNVPQIFGFCDNDCDPSFHFSLDPVHLTERAASNIWDKTQNERDLYNLYLFYSKQTEDAVFKNED